MSNRSPFRYFKTSPEIIRLAVMMYARRQRSRIAGVFLLAHFGGQPITMSKISTDHARRQRRGGQRNCNGVRLSCIEGKADFLFLENDFIRCPRTEI